MSPSQFGTGASPSCHAQKFYTVEEVSSSEWKLAWFTLFVGQDRLDTLGTGNINPTLSLDALLWWQNSQMHNCHEPGLLVQHSDGQSENSTDSSSQNRLLLVPVHCWVVFSLTWQIYEQATRSLWQKASLLSKPPSSWKLKSVPDELQGIPDQDGTGNKSQQVNQPPIPLLTT